MTIQVNRSIMLVVNVLLHVQWSSFISFTVCIW